MIPQQKVEEIFQAARIEEVIGEFVSLKRSGASYKGLSPFTTEKTPSFMVSPAKGIFKDFSSGKGGNVVNFLMELEHFTYPEALRWLAERYNIEIEEQKLSPELEEARNERESLFVINDFARTWFSEQMWKSEEGQNIGLSYFRERGFNESIIEKFQLGYNPDDYQAFTDVAKDKGYKAEYLHATALVKEKNGREYDGYKGRVIFPIQNLSGRVIGFGGRTLKADKNIPKYINSPENAIYDKSKSLYGIYFAKSAIAKEDNCYLVEGYTDVLAFYQKHIENTVASSGTALTRDQIKIIKRYSQNITLVYDGDPAGIKASLRGIDLILEEGVNVKIILLPDGHDPDSFSKAHDRIEVKEYLEGNAKDFIAFKADLLMQDAKGDPIKTNEVIHAMVDSIALIPDTILRSIYIAECSKRMNVSESALLSELNKSLRKNHRQKHRIRHDEEPEAPVIQTDFQQDEKLVEDTLSYQERDLLRIMVNHPDKDFAMEAPIDEKEDSERYNVVDFILNEIEGDGLVFETDNYRKLFETISSDFDETKLSFDHYVHHTDEVIQSLYIDLVTSLHKLDDWERMEIFVTLEEERLRRAVLASVNSYKSRRVERMIKEQQQLLKDRETLGGDIEDILVRLMKLNSLKRAINEPMGRVVIR